MTDDTETFFRARREQVRADRKAGKIPLVEPLHNPPRVRPDFLNEAPLLRQTDPPKLGGFISTPPVRGKIVFEVFGVPKSESKAKQTSAGTAKVNKLPDKALVVVPMSPRVYPYK